MTQTISPPSDLDAVDLLEPLESTWRLLAVGVPAGWKPDSWRSFPPGASPGLPNSVASAVALLLNADRMQRGPVRAWTFRLKMGGSKSAWITVQLPNDGWQPVSPYDIPPCATELKAINRFYAQQMVERMNESCGPTSRIVAVMPLDPAAPLLACLNESLLESVPQDHGRITA